MAVGNTMSPKIEFETADGTDSIERDEWHNHVDGYVVAFNNPAEAGTTDKVTLPKERVVSITETQ